MPQAFTGHFDPFEAHIYTVDQLIGFMQSEGLSLQEIHQVRNMAQLSIQDFLKMLAAEVCSVDDIRACDVPPKTIATLKERQMILNIQRNDWEQIRTSTDPEVFRSFIEDYPDSAFSAMAAKRLETITDSRDWEDACRRHTMGAYALYIEDHPEGAHRDEAMAQLRKLETEEAEITAVMLDDMRSHPWNYPPSMMSNLLNGTTVLDPDAPRPKNDEHLPPCERFLARGLRLNFKTLVDNGVVPPTFTEEIVQRPEYSLPQTADFNNFPLDRTDIFFLGVPRSGKSTVLSALFYTMYREGRWKHKVNIDPKTKKDPSLQYYHGLLKAVQAHKPPESTSTDTISYISMDVPAGERRDKTAHLNFVEISGEAVEKLAESISTDQSSTVVWDRLGASNVMRNNNSKILFFLLDYNTIIDNTDGMDVLEQELTLKTALDVLTNDGKGRDNTDGCTMSKVESVAILLTKADLMGSDSVEERQQIAMQYLQSNFKGFMNTLSQYCVKFDINHRNGNKPLVFTFSAGKFFVGNTMEFDDHDTTLLAKRIEELAPYKKGGLF